MRSAGFALPALLAHVGFDPRSRGGHAAGDCAPGIIFLKKVGTEDREVARTFYKKYIDRRRGPAGGRLRVRKSESGG